jgi:cyclomaltodextrinase / maltogenic alpha-amylase / neopullulanase
MVSNVHFCSIKTSKSKRMNKNIVFGLTFFVLIFSTSKVILAQLIKGIASPITLQMGATEVLLKDYVTDVSAIDSISVHPSMKKNYSAKSDKIVILPNPTKAPSLSVLRIWSKGKSEAILVQKSRKEVKVIAFEPKGKEYKKVSIAGDFNSWSADKTPLNFSNGKWIGILNLNPGSYSYQMVLDGKWTTDKNNKDSVSNGSGGYNSVLKIGKPFEIFPSIMTDKIVGNTVYIKPVTRMPADTVIAFLNNQTIESAAIKKDSVGFSIQVNSSLKGINWLRIYSYNRIGASNDLLIPFVDGKIDTSFVRKSKYNMAMYFALVDRFNNGNKGNDKPVKDKDIDVRANYQGGDLAGITQKIKDGYFKNLGINTIWISPIVQNPEIGYVEFPEPKRKYSGYHGYWPISSSKIDNRFGTDAELKELVAEAHKSGIKVLLDFVANHVHEEHPLYKNHKNWTTPIDLPDGKKNIRIWDDQRLTTWFDTFLPDLDYSKPEVINAMTDSAVWWIKNYQLDGFRHDATKHVSEDFWRALTLKLKTTFPDKEIFQIGETFGSRELIGTYVNSGQQDSQFDFNTYFDARETFAKSNNDFTKLKNSVYETFSYYGSHHLMGNISGNHDIARFISYAGEGMTFDEDDRKVAWSREVQVKNPVGYKRLLQLQAFNLTIPGIPVIYYGDEFGMPGAGDPDNRRMMKFEGLNEFEKQTIEATKKLLKLRESSNALLLGDTYFLKATKGEFAYMRHYFGDTKVIVFNSTDSVKSIDVPLPLPFKFTKVVDGAKLKAINQNGLLKIEIPANGFEIITLK